MSTQATDLATKKVFTTGEAAQVCKVSQQTIIRCFDSGRLQGFRVPGSKFRRIPRDELLRFMRDNDIPTDLLDGGRKRILVVDDDPAIIELFQDLFEADGRFETRAARTGYDAGMLTESFNPHLVILDYMLPDINGNLVCERLRERDNDTRVLVISGVVNREEIDSLIGAGADAFLRKPFDLDELMNHVNTMLGVRAAGLNGHHG